MSSSMPVGPVVRDSSTAKRFYYVFAFPIKRPRDKSALDDQFLFSDIHRVLYHCLLYIGTRYVYCDYACDDGDDKNKTVIIQSEILKKNHHFSSSFSRYAYGFLIYYTFTCSVTHFLF